MIDKYDSKPTFTIGPVRKWSFLMVCQSFDSVFQFNSVQPQSPVQDDVYFHDNKKDDDV